jgi:hypothetical protein
MFIAWWWLWIVFLFAFLLMPTGYGWGYRRWGPPYPRYMQRRRAARAAERGDAGSFDHHAWGWGGDLLWLMFTLWVIWFLFVVLW